MAEWRFQIGVGIILFSLAMASARAEPPGREQAADAKQFDDQFRPLMVRHCVACHGADKPKRKLRLDTLPADFADPVTRARWATVVERLEAGEMPPKGKPRPAAKDVTALLGWLRPRIAADDAAVRAEQGRVVLRRLNRVEYENTIRDLLAINIKLKEQLPEDGSADGLDNAGAAKHTSSFLMEKYLEAAFSLRIPTSACFGCRATVHHLNNSVTRTVDGCCWQSRVESSARKAGPAERARNVRGPRGASDGVTTERGEPSPRSFGVHCADLHSRDRARVAGGPTRRGSWREGEGVESRCTEWRPVPATVVRLIGAVRPNGDEGAP
jgi:mono/diheme cytochrome c family protein